MLARRLIATILLKNGDVVQSRQFKHTNIIGSAYTAIDFLNAWCIDEIIILDVSRQKDLEFLTVVEGFTERCFVPLAVGGWLRSIADIRAALNAGADKIVVNTYAFQNPDFITEAAEKFGSQCITVAIDVKDGFVYIDRGRKATEINPVTWAKQAEKLGAGEIYLTSINHDGMGKGYDLDLIQSVSSAVNIPVIASGGVGQWEHLKEGLKYADAVSVANKFHYMEHSAKKAKEYLMTTGYPIRPADFFSEEEFENVSL